MSLASGSPALDRPPSHGPTSQSTTRYQRLQHHDDGNPHVDHDNGHHGPLMGPMVDVMGGGGNDREREMTASPNSVFRSRANATTPSHYSDAAAGSSTERRRPSWTARSLSDDVVVGETEKDRRRTDGGDHGQDDVEAYGGRLRTSRSHQSLVSALSPQSSRDWMDDGADVDDDDDHHRNAILDVEDDHDLQEDDEIIRRYHHHVMIHTRVPTLPAEFAGRMEGGHDGGTAGPLLVRKARQVWIALTELRRGARQRRAARLLNPNSRHDFCQTWFCDATDRGIALAAILTALWLMLGLVTTAHAWYWWFGLFLFGIRVSARTTYEALVERKRRRKRNRSAMMVSTGRSIGTEKTAAAPDGRGNDEGVLVVALPDDMHYRDHESVPMV